MTEIINHLIAEIFFSIFMFSSVIVGIVQAMVTEPRSILLAILCGAIAIATPRWWLIPVGPLLASLFISAVAYPGYVEAGLDPMEMLPTATLARFLIFLAAALLIKLGYIILKRKTKP